MRGEKKGVRKNKGKGKERERERSKEKSSSKIVFYLGFLIGTCKFGLDWIQKEASLRLMCVA